MNMEGTKLLVQLTEEQNVRRKGVRRLIKQFTYLFRGEIIGEVGGRRELMITG